MGSSASEILELSKHFCTTSNFRSGKVVNLFSEIVGIWWIIERTHSETTSKLLLSMRLFSAFHCCML